MTDCSTEPSSNVLRRVIISGGGTGGHIHPALALADELRRRNPKTEILFVGALGRMEMDRIPAAGYEIIGLPITGIDRKISMRNVLFPLRLLRSIFKAHRILRSFAPEVAIGVGGFASGPLLWAASSRGIPTVIQEQNSFPGITNRLMARRADLICAGFPGLHRWFPAERITVTGNPLRSTISGLADENQAEARAHFSLKPDRPTVFVMGGSLGAVSMNRAVEALIKSGAPARSGYQLLWQCGDRHLAASETFHAQHDAPMNVAVRGFIDRMDQAYIAADIIASRAGALAIAELAMVGKPALLVPSPHVTEDHQTRNARSLVDRGGAQLLPDNEVVAALDARLKALLDDAILCADLSAGISACARPHAASDVINRVESLVANSGANPSH
jgi:UDP-N-acetylglucosamine--N-acetylmuramyl-(pentapeptide) pyrophosphoryl-undecaprenol N-acetylglucosamine transferase